VTVADYGKQEGDETPEGQLKNDLGNLVAQWEELGIDPDDFVKCATCGEYFVDERGDFIDCACDREQGETT